MKFSSSVVRTKDTRLHHCFELREYTLYLASLSALGSSLPWTMFNHGSLSFLAASSVPTITAAFSTLQQSDITSHIFNVKLLEC